MLLNNGKKTQIKIIIEALVGPLITGPSSIHQKTAAKAWNRYQKWLSKMQEMEHEFP